MNATSVPVATVSPLDFDPAIRIVVFALYCLVAVVMIVFLVFYAPHVTGHVLARTLTWVLRRRKIPVFPLWVVGLNVLISVLLTFGNTRYRTPFEVPLVLLSSALYAYGYDQWRQRRSRDEPLDAPADTSAPDVLTS